MIQFQKPEIRLLRQALFQHLRYYDIMTNDILTIWSEWKNKYIDNFDNMGLINNVLNLKTILLLKKKENMTYHACFLHIVYIIYIFVHKSVGRLIETFFEYTMCVIWHILKFQLFYITKIIYI